MIKSLQLLGMLLVAMLISSTPTHALTSVLATNVYKDCISQFNDDKSEFNWLWREGVITTHRDVEDICSCTSNAIIETGALQNLSAEQETLYQQKATECINPYIDEYARHAAYKNCLPQFTADKGIYNILLKQELITSTQQVDKICTCMSHSTSALIKSPDLPKDAEAKYVQESLQCVAPYMAQYFKQDISSSCQADSGIDGVSLTNAQCECVSEQMRGRMTDNLMQVLTMGDEHIKQSVQYCQKLP